MESNTIIPNSLIVFFIIKNSFAILSLIVSLFYHHKDGLRKIFE
jgi:hypothetical protein